MNKSKILTYIVISILLISGIGTAIYFAIQKQDNSSDTYNEKDKTSEKTDEIRITGSREITKDDRTVTINGRIYDLKYNRTTTTYKNSDGYGSYDIYIDELNNDYLFLCGSDLLCSFLLYNPKEEKTDEIISMEAATKEAISFMKNNISGWEEYILEPEESYCEISGRSYMIQFCKEINGYKTDDTARVSISKYNKQLNGFSARNMKRYDKAELSIEQINSAEKALEDRIKNEFKDGKVITDSVFISKDENGNMVIAQGVFPIMDDGEESFVGEGEIYTQIID